MVSSSPSILHLQWSNVRIPKVKILIYSFHDFSWSFEFGIACEIDHEIEYERHLAKFGHYINFSSSLTIQDGTTARLSTLMHLKRDPNDLPTYTLTIHVIMTLKPTVFSVVFYLDTKEVMSSIRQNIGVETVNSTKYRTWIACKVGLHVRWIVLKNVIYL